MNTILFGVDLTTIRDFEDFASSHYAYDEEGNQVWAPTNMNEFIKFMRKHYATDSEARANFAEGAEEWNESINIKKLLVMKKQQAQTKKTIHLSDVFVYTRFYEIEYGRKPKGYGCWAFSIGNTEAYKDVIKAFWTESSCTYTQAVRQAKEEAIRRGVTCVYVLP